MIEFRIPQTLLFQEVIICGRIEFAVVGQLQQGLQQERELGRGRHTADGRIVQVHTGIHAYAAYRQHLSEVPCRKTARIVEREDVADVTALPFFQILNLAQTAIQQQFVMKNSGTGHLFIDDAHPVGKGPDGAARDRFPALVFYPDFLALGLHPQGVGSMPTVIVARFYHRAVQVRQIVIEQFLVLVQAVRRLPIFQGKVGQLLQKGVGKAVELGVVAVLTRLAYGARLAPYRKWAMQRFTSEPGAGVSTDLR